MQLHMYSCIYVHLYSLMCIHIYIHIRDLFAFPVVPCKSHNHPPANMVVEPLQPFNRPKHHPTKASTLEEHHAESGPDLVQAASIWSQS